MCAHCASPNCPGRQVPIRPALVIKDEVDGDILGHKKRGEEKKEEVAERKD